MQFKPAKTSIPIHDIISKRWSCRSFDASRIVERKQIIALLEAARWAPSCYGDEPWRFIVWDKNTDATAWHRAFDCLVEWNQNWVKNAPLLLLVTANSLFSKNGKPNAWGQYDSGAAAENLCLQAVSMGLMAHQMGGFDAKKVQKEFNIPEQFNCMAMIAVGYQSEETSLNEELKDLELAPRERTALSEHFFEGTWGVSIK